MKGSGSEQGVTLKRISSYCFSFLLVLFGSVVERRSAESEGIRFRIYCLSLARDKTSNIFSIISMPF